MSGIFLTVAVATAILKTMRTILIIAGATVVLLAGGVLWSKTIQSRNPDIISQGGIHSHPQLTVYVKGVKVDIPANLGIGLQFANTRGYDPQMQMAAVHTHEDLPIIHLEFMEGPVYKQDVTLGQFFKNWGKGMRSFGTSIRMTVNGKENTQYENYVMKDGDKIELRFD